MEYKHLTQEQRYQIYAYSKANWTQKEMSRELKVHRSTVSREIKRNRGLRGYRPQQANKRAERRKFLAHKHIKMSSYLKFLVAQKIREDWSPEQISGYFKRHNIAHISHPTIYTYIKLDRNSGGQLYKRLRRARKKYKKRYGSSDLRGQIRNKIMIDERPKIVDEKTRIGDWEIDTVIGKQHNGVIVTLVERKSKYMIASPVRNKSEPVVTNALIQALRPFKEKAHTITSDNGKEFAGHEKVAKDLKAKFYFAHPYSSWERGLNENSNGLLRQYYPKKTDLRDIKSTDMDPILEKINNRPRKTLGYATPKELFFGLIDSDNIQYQNVALIT